MSVCVAPVRSVRKTNPDSSHESDQVTQALSEETQLQAKILSGALHRLLESALDQLDGELHDLASSEKDRESVAIRAEDVAVNLVPVLGAVKSYADARIELEEGLTQHRKALVVKAREDYVVAVFQLALDAEPIGWGIKALFKLGKALNLVHLARTLVPHMDEKTSDDFDPLIKLADLVLKIPGAKKLVDSLLALHEPPAVKKLLGEFEAFELKCAA